jgi:hypothetical protein
MILKRHIVLIVLIVVSCSSKHPAEADALQLYLQDSFKISIPDSLHYFLFIPAGGCNGCVAFATDLHDRGLLRDNVTVVYLEYGDFTPWKDTIRKSVYHGSADRAIYNYDLYVSTVRLYETLNFEATKVYDITANNIAQVFSYTVIKARSSDVTLESQHPE